MKRFTLLAATALLVAGTVGCHHNCNNCGPCGGGLLGRFGAGHHGDCSVATGCRACKLGWQHGGLDYSEGLATGNPLHSLHGRQSPAGYGPGGPMAGGAMAGGAMAGGAPTGAVAYPYYTVRGPRDFLLDNPPSIGR